MAGELSCRTLRGVAEGEHGRFIRNRKYLPSWVVQGECTYVTVQEHILL